MKHIRKLFQIALFTCIVSSISAASFTDRFISLTAGTALALVAHNILEYISTATHELGHSVTNKLITGDPIRFTVTPQSGPVKLLQPWVGASYYSQHSRSRLADMLITGAGPLAGIASTQVQLYLLSLLEKQYIPTTQPATSWQQPLPFMKELYHLGERQASGMSEPMSIAQTTLTMLKFLRCSRLVGETLYGFTPITQHNVIGDGQVLWHKLLNRKSSAYPLVSNRLLSITSAAMIAPLAIGIGKALIQKQKSASSDNVH